MSQETVEQVRAIYDATSKGDFRTSLDLFDPHVVLVLGPDFPDAGMHSGIEAVSAYTRALLEPWTHFTMEADELIDAGDTVFASVRQHGVGSTSGVPAVLRYFSLWTFRGGKVIHIESFRERADAFAAAGLAE
jgi:ketosteroid isomerase-like protein